jgi:hypothetical protein
VDQQQSSNPQQKVYEIIQYPLVKTTDVGEGDNLITLSVRVTRGNAVQLDCDIDRALELTYCVGDVLDVLISPKTGVA